MFLNDLKDFNLPKLEEKVSLFRRDYGGYVDYSVICL